MGASSDAGLGVEDPQVARKSNSALSFAVIAGIRKEVIDTSTDRG